MLAQLCSFSFAPILSFWSINAKHDPRVFTLLVIAAGLFLFASVVLLALGRRSRAALFRVAAIESVALIALFNWKALGGLRNAPLSMTVAEHLLAVVLMTALVLVVVRYGATRGLRAVLGGVAFVVLLSTTGQLVRAELSLNPPTLPQASVPDPRVGAGPDIYYIVVDGYGRADVLRERYALNLTGFHADLSSRGFAVLPRATANYPITTVSIPSVLAMDFPLEPGVELAGSEERALNRIVRGSNPVVRYLKARGYRYVQVESGLPATRCGSVVDQCMGWPPLDDTVLGLLESTPIAPLFKRSLQRLTAEETLSRFRRVADVGRSETGGVPRFVFAHLLPPHPPLFLRADCTIDLDGRRAGNDVGAPPFRAYVDFRRAAYADQVRCVNEQLLELIDALPREAVVVIAGDHGPDSGEQLWKPVEQWTSEDIVERMSIFAAVRFPADCRDGVPPNMSLVNAFRLVFNCLFDASLPILPNRVLLVRTGKIVVERTPL